MPTARSAPPGLPRPAAAWCLRGFPADSPAARSRCARSLAPWARCARRAAARGMCPYMFRRSPAAPPAAHSCPGRPSPPRRAPARTGLGGGAAATHPRDWAPGGQGRAEQGAAQPTDQASGVGSALLGAAAPPVPGRRAGGAGSGREAEAPPRREARCWWESVVLLRGRAGAPVGSCAARAGWVLRDASQESWRPASAPVPARPAPHWHRAIRKMRKIRGNGGNQADVGFFPHRHISLCPAQQGLPPRCLYLRGPPPPSTPSGAGGGTETPLRPAERGTLRSLSPFLHRHGSFAELDSNLNSSALTVVSCPRWATSLSSCGFPISSSED